jgi:hypothetical protein
MTTMSSGVLVVLDVLQVSVCHLTGLKQQTNVNRCRQRIYR